MAVLSLCNKSYAYVYVFFEALGAKIAFGLTVGFDKVDPLDERIHSALFIIDMIQLG